MKLTSQDVSGEGARRELLLRIQFGDSELCAERFGARVPAPGVVKGFP